MPYIKQNRRYSVLFPDSAGELNYYISLTINKYIQNKKLNYQTINDVVGALESAKLEFYRRIASPYEDKKLTENGDVYDVDGD